MDVESNKLAQMACDVVVVGSGAAGLTAATVAADAGMSVAVLEAAPAVGGTTRKSSGGFWVPRNPLMSKQGATDERFVDDRESCLAHMARLSYPQDYRRGSERHGLSPLEWDLIVNYYDHAAETFEELRAILDTSYMFMTSFRG